MNAEQVKAADLDLIVKQLTGELPKLSGRNLLIAGGAGFLGYYLVQAALHWNKLNPQAPPINVTVLDNFMRGVPDWLTALAGSVRLLKHDITQPLPADLGDQQYIVHAASIALADLLPQAPDRDDGRERQRPALPARLRGRAEGRRGSRSRASCSISLERDLRRPDAGRDPDAGDLPRQRVLHRAARLLRRVEALRRDAVRELRPAARLPIKMARPFNNYGPGLKITDRRVLPDFARDILAGPRHRHAVRRHRRRARSATSPTRSPATTRCWCAAAPARRTTSASRRRRSRWPSSPSGSSRSAASCSATRARSCTGASEDGGLPRRQPEPPLPGHHQGAHRARLRPAGPDRRGPAPRRCSGTRGNREAADA